MLTKKNIFKLTLLAVVSMLLLTLVVGVSAQDALKLTISFPGDPRSDTVNALIHSFVTDQASKGVTINTTVNEPTSGYDDQLLLDFSAGVGPDVFSISPEAIPEYVAADLILPLDDRLAAWDGWSNFPSGMQLMPSLNGSTYAVMYNTDTRVLFYRKDVFEAAGITLPWHPTSWDDIFAAAQMIKDNVPDVVPMEVESGTIWGEGTTIDGFLMLLSGAGGVLYDASDGKWIVESPAMLESLQFYSKMFGDGLSAAEPFMQPDPWVYFLQDGIAKGKVGMGVVVSVAWDLFAPDSTWAPISNRDEVLGWTPMPARQPGAGINGWDYVGMGGGWAWAISKTSANADLAWEFVQYMTSADSVSAYAKGVGGIPSRADAPTTDFNAAVATDVLPYQSFRPGSADYTRVSEQIQIATEKILLGEATAEEAMAQYATAVEGIVGADNVKRLSE